MGQVSRAGSWDRGTTTKTVPEDDATLNQFVSSPDALSPSTSTASETTPKHSVKLPKSSSRSKKSSSKSLSNLALDRLKLNPASHSGDTSLDTAISSKSETSDDKSLGRILEIPWFSSMTNNNISLRRKEVSRDRKQKWIFKSTQTHRFDKLVRMRAQKLGRMLLFRYKVVGVEHDYHSSYMYAITSTCIAESYFKINYLLALCESDLKEELLLLLEVIDITRFSSMGHLANIFRSLGRFSKALASHWHISDALNIYKEIKQAECNVEPKAIICLIEHLQSERELGRLLQLLEEVNYPKYWIDGCCMVILYCVERKYLSSTVDLLKQLKDKFCDDEGSTEVLFDEVFCKIAETEPSDLQFGLDLLQAIKEELQVRPSRRSLDFLLSACVSAKDLNSSLLIWKEYYTAGLPYNGLTFLRIYQALLASGDLKAATKKLNQIPKDDPHDRCVIKACQTTCIRPASLKGKNKKNNIEKGEEMRRIPY
ncbi:pentatricopeptide repeat-containing protein At4g04790, mitochondrial-like [Actinidia eriantha]|uniref:pentatricopeptide repeat-containing protein At4g04790, mitochondrial-like n=1 Tax=Actinidia eriantha TaxID=165200 RepID=UPI0025873BB7|nr:pentatricopeptide repeat-containing protein At4g04790, mitochondrial-like [Actinidia eriantha]